MTHTIKAKLSKMKARAMRLLLLRIYIAALASRNTKLLSFFKVKRTKSKGKKHKKHRSKRRKGKKSRKSGRKLSPGVHHVRVGKHIRKVRVLANGKWQFMKG